MDYLISISDQLTPQLRSMRKARKLNQTELGRKLGLSQSRIAAIERNPAAVNAGQLLEILKVLGVALVLRDLQASAASTSIEPKLLDSYPKGEW
jgi:HTH-type transcriptional regulator/antitoxin HipB